MDVNDVTTPFRIMIPSGESTFTVYVPKNYIHQDRKFFFPDLRLQPDFFSREADRLALDADPEMDKFVDHPIQVKVDVRDPMALYGSKYIHSKAAKTTMDMIENINHHFESNKPEWAITSPFFIDWIDKDVHDNNDPKKYIPLMAQTYYKTFFYNVLHSDKLPASVRDIDGVNNGLFPIDTMPEILFNLRIRLRIWMAPHTRAIFSSNAPFITELGFKAEDFGDAIGNQYHIVNRSHHWVPMAVAETAPKANISKLDFKITLGSFSDYYTTGYLIARLKKRQWEQNDTVAIYMTELFNSLSRQSNILFNFGYRSSDRIFFFNLPSNNNFNVIISMPPVLSMRLGFGTEPFIKQGMQALPQKEKEDTILNAQRKALAVVYDTGPIICTLDQVSSNTTSGSIDLFMAALYPHESGELNMSQTFCSCKTNAVRLQILTQSNAALVPITFRLLRIYDNGKISNFNWTQDAYVYGALQGFHYPKL